MKKTIGFLFLLLANFALLAHTVIPHHHHHEDIDSICYLFSADDAHNNCHHDIGEHDHGSNGLGDDCILNGLYIRVASVHNASPSEEGQPAYGEPAAGFPFICYNVDLSVALGNDGALPFRHQPFLLSSYNQFVTCSLGLRAPPVC
jgi:hypothetical protein